MSLEKWVEYGWLRREPTSTGEIKDLLGIVDRSLADSKVEAVSTDLRFIAAFNAALCIATTALRASGLRTVSQAGHHVKTIESLELTIKANPNQRRRFRCLRRHNCGYSSRRTSRVEESFERSDPHVDLLFTRWSRRALPQACRLVARRAIHCSRTIRIRHCWAAHR